MRHVQQLAFLIVLLFGAACQQERELATPEATLAFYLESLRNADQFSLDRTMLSGEGFAIQDSLPLDSFSVTRSEVLSAEQASAYTFIPSPEPGDAVLDVAQHFAGADEEQMYTYFMRERGGEWLLYSWSAWGVDVITDDML